MQNAKAFVQEVVLDPLRQSGLISDHVACDLYGSIPDDFEQETFACMLVVEDGQTTANGLPFFVTTDTDAFRAHLRYCYAFMPTGWRKRLTFSRCLIENTGLLLVVLKLNCDGFITDCLGVCDGR